MPAAYGRDMANSVLVAGAVDTGGPDEVLTDSQVRAFVVEHLRAARLDGQRVCVLVPDATRTCPLPLLVSAVRQALQGRVAGLTLLVALGTHADMDPSALTAHLGVEAGAQRAGTSVLTHAWWQPETFVQVGMVGADRLAELSGGLLRQDVPVQVNRAVVEHDVTLIVGPVFPHEVVGFSGGDKYLFPGVSGREFIDVSHWLGALVTSAEIIGTRGVTPVRALIDEAASMVPGRRLALCCVTDAAGHGLHSLAFGEPSAAWQAAADVSAQTHVRYLDAPVRRVLSLIPTRYDDLWTGAKGFYKVEPIVADGGQVVLYAPHIRQISATHPQVAQIGYHVRDYFVKQWDRFAGLHWGDLAHSTHLRGAGTYDPQTGEHPRVTVTLATGIPEDVTRAVNLDYLDPATLDVAGWEADPDTLVVHNAGEDLYRLR